MVEDATTKSYFSWTERKDYQGIWRYEDPDEQVVFIYDGAPAYHNPGNPGPNTELKKLPPYSSFLNIVEQAISLLKAAIKADISRPEIQREMNNRDEARRQGIPLGHYRTQLLMEALQQSNAGTITSVL